VRVVDPTRDPRWDVFVEHHPTAQATHRSSWLDVLAQEYEQPQVHLLCEDTAGQVQGVLPLVETRGVPLGLGGARGRARLSSLPRTSMAGPIADTPLAATTLLTAAAAHAEERGRLLQLKPVDPDLDGLVPGIVGIPWWPTYVLDLPEDAAAGCFDTRHRHKRLRHLVLKSEREGVRVREGEAADLDAWYRLYLAPMRRHVQPARPRRLFAALLARCQDSGLGRFTVAEAGMAGDRHLVAGTFFLTGSTTASYAFTGLDRAAATAHPLDALLWDAIHHAHATGLRHVDLGQVPPDNPSLATFKLKWGTQPVPVRRYHRPALEPAEPRGTESPTRRSTAGERLWQRVPLPVTAYVGGAVQRFL
jgi:hypothetical protein